MPLLGRERWVSKQPGRGFFTAVGLTGLAVATLLFWIGYNAPNKIPGRGYYTIQAELNEADNLTSHYQVRVAGRLVGQILHPRVEGNKAIVDLQLEKDIQPLRSDTTIRVRPRSPIGVRFLELHPGTKGTPIPEGGRLKATQATASLPLDEVFKSLDAPTRARTRVLLTQLGAGFAGRGEDLNPTIEAAPQMLRDLGTTSRAIVSRDGATTRFVRGLEIAAASADPVREAIGKGFKPEAQALKVFGDTRASLDKTFQVAPAALAGVRTGLAQSDPFVRELGGFARAALPFLRQAPSSLDQTAALLQESRPTLRAADQTLTLAGRAVNPTLNLLRIVHPAIPDLERALREATAPVVELGPRRCDLNLMFRNWESMLGYGTQAGNYLRLNVVQGTGQSLGGLQENSPDPVPVFRNPYPAPCESKRDPLQLRARGR